MQSQDTVAQPSPSQADVQRQSASQQLPVSGSRAFPATNSSNQNGGFLFRMFPLRFNTSQ